MWNPREKLEFSLCAGTVPEVYRRIRKFYENVFIMSNLQSKLYMKNANTIKKRVYITCTITTLELK